MKRRIRTIVRGTLAAAIVIFALYAAGRVQSGAADGTPLAMVSACLLILLLVAVSRHPRRS